MEDNVKKYLDKVLDRIVSKTTIDYDKERAYTTFSFHRFYPSSLSHIFKKHCIDVYGLNKEETEYVWNEYKDIINNKINNG